MEEKIFDSHNFKFALYLNDTPIMERVFDGNGYKSGIGLDFKSTISKITNGFKNVLQTSSNRLNFKIGKYDNLAYYKKMRKLTNLSDETLMTSDILVRNSTPVEKHYEVEYEDETVQRKYYEDETENFKYRLYKDGKIVIERNFVCVNYNPEARLSTNLLEFFNKSVNNIINYMYSKDLELV